MMRIATILILFILTIQCKPVENNFLSQRVQFVAVEKARALLTSEDSFTRSWSQFDIDSRLGKSNGRKSELFDHISQQALEWTDQEKEKINSIIEKVYTRITTLKININFPENIYFVKTTSQEEGGALGYTRENYIVLSENIKSASAENLEHLVTHELFHVLSRHDAQFKEKMYNIIGFQLMDNMEYPKSIKELRITNPDATLTDSYISLSIDGQDSDCTMILYAGKAYEGGSFFKYLNVGFLKLTDSNPKKVYLNDGEPVIYKQDEISGFTEQVGENTNYTIHPEEIMADNFTFAILGEADLKTPGIVEKIISELQK